MLAVISDVHGNYPALKAVLAEIDRMGCTRILSLGDVSGYYCMVNECIDVFRERGIINLMGNHDYYLVHGKRCPRSATVNDCLSYQRNIITEKNFAFLEKSLAGYDDGVLSARHGGWNDALDEYIAQFNFSIAATGAETIFASGHTHIQRIERLGPYTYFNPGSVGQPRDGDCQAAFAFLGDDGNVELRRVAYDISETERQMNKEGFPDRVSSCLYAGVRIGG